MSVRTFKKLSKKLIQNTKPLIFLCIFAYIITQPHRFVVDGSKENTEIVKAAYEQLLEQSTKKIDGSIQFETLIVGENGETTISYIVAAGDSLGSIAKSFGTSTEAIMKANTIADPDKLRPGQKLVIVYDDGVLVNAKSTMKAGEFARHYELDMEEFMSMNYFKTEDTIVEKGWQVFVPLNQIEAEKRGLTDKEAFVMLDLPQKEHNPSEEEKRIAHNEANEAQDITSPSKTLVEEKLQQVKEGEGEKNYEQIVISAEETQQHLENLKKQEEEARLAAEEAKRKAEEAKIAAEKAKREAEEARTAAAKRAAQEAKRKAEEAKIAAEKEAARAVQRAVEAQKAQANAQQVQEVVECSANQCVHKGKCWTKPANAYCAESDPGNAWLCNEGFLEMNGSCVDKNSAIAQAPSRPTGTVLEQWYFNPHKVDSNVYGRGPGHCTAMAAYLWSQNYGIRIRDYWTGNAKEWLNNARNAGFTVNNTPAPGSLMVSGSGYGTWGPYGHVMYVESVNWNAGTLVVIDMNYKGRYVATKRVEAINKARGFIHPM